MKNKRSRRKGKASFSAQFKKTKIHQEPSSYTTACGGLTLLHQLSRHLHFKQHLDRSVNVLKIHQGYRESDHLFHLMSAFFTGASCLEDLSRLQHDQNYHRLLGSQRVSNPGTMGDFLRRFTPEEMKDLHCAFSSIQNEAWNRLPVSKRKQASLDLDSKICPTTGS